MEDSFNILSREAALLLPLVHGQMQLDAQADPVGAAAFLLHRCCPFARGGNGKLHPVLVALDDGGEVLIP
ncbi:hypothetical protein D3C71_1698150 [compost metagenome]